MAELYLNYRNDERAYAQCHEELVRANPTTHSFVMLGEAYMKINEADKAAAAFEPLPPPPPPPPSDAGCSPVRSRLQPECNAMQAATTCTQAATLRIV